MGKLYADRQKDNQSEDDLFYCSKNMGKLTGPDDIHVLEPKTWNLVRGAKPGRTLILKLIQSETHDNWLQELFLKQSSGLGIGVPKHLVSLDEKYLRRCLELIHNNASKGAPCSLSVNMSSLGTGFMSDYVTVAGRNSLDGPKYAIDYPVGVASRDLGVSPVDEGIVGSIMGSNSMMSILSSPLFQRLGLLDHYVGLGGTSLFENKRCIPCDYQGSPSRLIYSPSKKPGKETLALRDQAYRTDSGQKNPLSISSGLSVPVDRSSESSFSPSDSQGMLQCTWDGGIPRFTFSLDDQKELYVANAWKIEDTNDKALDYVYSFHLKPSSQKVSDIFDKESDLIGKMKVSTTFSLCPSNSKVMEMEFVSVGLDENHAREMYHLSRSNRRSRKLSKVMEMFKSGNSLKQRTPSVFGGTSAIPEDFSAEKALEVPSNLDKQQYRPSPLENDFLPNLEMAAIVVKDHVQSEIHHEEVVGGWGLKFLKKAGVKQNVASLDVSASPECCQRSIGNCSTSMDIIVPAGPHGGPRTRNGGPNSLIERWRSGGHCDCGGWDIGCPLKILKARPREEEGWPSSETPRGYKSFDLFIEGSKQGTPMLKMVNIHDSLYYLSFQSSSLSTLQSFSIAVAIVHSQSPTLRPKHVQH